MRRFVVFPVLILPSDRATRRAKPAASPDCESIHLLHSDMLVRKVAGLFSHSDACCNDLAGELGLLAMASCCCQCLHCCGDDCKCLLTT